MSDISTIWNRTRGDYVLAGADLQTNNDLLTAVTISLFTDRVAQPDDQILDGSGDRRGWWGDTEQYQIGSRLWQLERAKRSQDTLAAAQSYIEEALQWLIDDGVVARFGIYVEWTQQHTLAAQVTAFKRDGTNEAMNLSWVWDDPKVTGLKKRVPDPFFSNVGLLLHFDGAATDTSANGLSVSAFNGAVVGTGVVKFGAGALTIPATANARVQTANVAPQQFTGPITIEFWVNLPGTAAGQYFVASNYSAGGSQAWFYTDGAGTVNCYLFGTAFPVSGSITANAWTHIAATFDGATKRFFVDGVLVSSQTATLGTGINVQPAPQGWCIGGADPSTASGASIRYIDDFRVTYGVARYTAAFTRPSLAFPDF